MSCSKTRRRNVGKEFEKDFSAGCPHTMALIRLQDGKGTAKNPCDYILLAGGRGIMLELKTTQAKSLPHQNIKPHQLEIMSRFQEELAIPAFFIVNFRVSNETFIAPAVWVRNKLLRKKSIPLADFRENCPILPQEIKRTRYKYNVEEILKYV